MTQGTGHRFFSASAALQDYLLQEAGPGTLVLTPHQRLAQQLWQRQRRQQIQAGRRAWEPLPLKTFQGWLQDLFAALWPEVALAPYLQRLYLWRRALNAASALPGAAADLSWAQALDETYGILCRHSLLAGRDARPTEDARSPDQAPLLAWRNQVIASFRRLLAEDGWLAPGELPDYLRRRLDAGNLTLPGRLLVAGLETPAPSEHAFLAAAARRTRVEHLQVRGDPQAVQAAVVLPDREQEVAWVAAQVLELAAQGEPLHRLAVTSLAMEQYGTRLQRVLGELLGPTQAEDGWAYNFSQRPGLAETPLFLAALLPLKFVAAGEHREDLVSLLLSPFYGALRKHRQTTAPWDRLFRERRIDQGWHRLKQAAARQADAAAARQLLSRFERLWEGLRPSAPGAQWAERLERLWRELAFYPVDEAETGTWSRLKDLVQELAATLGPETLGAGEYLEWLRYGAEKVILGAPGVQEAGIQVLGLLEMRGLEFSRVFCLGMNSGTLPPPPRSLPLLAAVERRAVLGGTYRSQHEFSRELYDTLRGAAPALVLSRPEVADDEERVGSPLYAGLWEKQEMAVLSRPAPAWRRSPAVRAALAGGGAAFSGYSDGPVLRELPAEISLSQAAAALSCPCRFLVEFLLKLRELPEIEAGLDPRERGDRLHRVLAEFTETFNEFLEENGWDHAQAQEVLAATAQRVLGDLLTDLHWRAELARWLGEGEGEPSLLKEWLRREQENYEKGWRWRLMEAKFAGLRHQGWPFALRGRLDRLDYHPERGEAIVWDYKSGEVPSAKKVFDELQEVQLPCYLLAVAQGLTGAPTSEIVRAGYIGLKSPKKEHLKHEDFSKRAGEWPRVAAALAARLQELGERLAVGDFRPAPHPAPEDKDLGACKYCPYALLCGFSRAAAPEADEEDSGSGT